LELSLKPWGPAAERHFISKKSQKPASAELDKAFANTVSPASCLLAPGTSARVGRFRVEAAIA
jgi:hypothetical protein